MRGDICIAVMPFKRLTVKESPALTLEEVKTRISKLQLSKIRLAFFTGFKPSGPGMRFVACYVRLLN